jgi:predicted DNA-binding transcriptional regulator AlpA
MKLENIELDSLKAIAEKAQKAHQYLKILQEIAEDGKKNKTPILLQDSEVAALLQISEGHLNVLRNRGTGPVYIKIGGSVCYDIADVFDYIYTNKFRSTAEYKAVQKAKKEERKLKLVSPSKKEAA